VFILYSTFRTAIGRWTSAIVQYSSNCCNDGTELATGVQGPVRRLLNTVKNRVQKKYINEDIIKPRRRISIIPSTAVERT